MEGKWGVAIDRLMHIIEKEEQKLAYFQNRLKKAQFIDRPKWRLVNTAGSQAEATSDQLGELKVQLETLRRLHSGGVKLRTTQESDLRRIWSWSTEPTLLHSLQLAPISFEEYVNDWHQWMADSTAFPLSIELNTGELIGFMLLYARGGHSDPPYASLEFIIVSPEYRHHGYGTDAVEAAIAFAFEEIEADAFTLEVDIDNEPAFQCFEKGGLRVIAPISDSEDGSNIEATGYEMAIYRQEWADVDSAFDALTQELEDDSNADAPSTYLSAKLLEPLKDLMPNQ